MSIFKLSVEGTSYKWPLIKLMVCISILVVIFFRKTIISAGEYAIILALNVICGVLMFPLILCILISIIEFGYVFNNKRKNRISLDVSVLPIRKIQDIVNMVQNNDIIEVVICVNGNIVSVGSSAELNRWSGKFFNKAYYIGQMEYLSVEEFSVALREGIGTDTVHVYTIDGICQK